MWLKKGQLIRLSREYRVQDPYKNQLPLSQDDTMEIVEPRRDNSGMPHGSLVKRHRFPSATAPERLVSPEDLRVGETFSIYGKTFALTACDAFTRVTVNRHDYKD